MPAQHSLTLAAAIGLSPASRYGRMVACRANRARIAFIMLLQTNSYVVPKEKRSEHARLVRKFRQTLGRLGCDQFDVFEQVGANWGSGETTGRFVQMMRFRDRKHQLAVQSAERSDPGAQQLIA